MTTGSANTPGIQDGSEAVVDVQEARTSGLPVMIGWRLWMVVLSLCLGLLLSTLESTIIATALVTISSDLGHFEKSSWIVVSYLITYTGFLIIVSRLSDIFGRKQALLVCLGFFTIWSAACGWAQTIEQLVVFRALQGIGGSGLFALAMAVVPEITPVAYMGHSSGAISAVSACSSVLGPIIGGVITSHSTWRWVFWLNIPGGVIVMAVVICVFPNNIGQERYSKALFKLIDWPGSVLLLLGSVTLVFALESGGIQFPWKSGPIISTFVIAGISWVLFPLWETYLTVRASKIKMLPIFPAARFMGHRVIASALATAFFTGFPLMVVVITLPQRFQIVNGLSPVGAGVRMLPLLLLSAVGAGAAGIICSKKNISFYLLVLSLALQIIGTALLSTLPVTHAVPTAQYGIQVVLGIGFGMSMVSLMIILRVEVEFEDHAVAMGAVTQVRIFGGVVGLAISQAVLLASLKSRLNGVLSQQQLAEILASAASISRLPSGVADITRQVYGDVANKQMRIVMGFAAAGLVVSLGAWRRHPTEFSDLARERPAPNINSHEATAVELTPMNEGASGNQEDAMHASPVVSDSKAPKI